MVSKDQEVDSYWSGSDRLKNFGKVSQRNTMPRSKEIPEDIRKKVVEAYETGKGYKLISKAVGLPKTTVRAILRKWKRFGTVVTLPRSGRPSKISPGARREIIREVMKNPCMTSKDLQATLASSNICVHHSTIRRILGVHGRPTLSSIEGSMALSSQEEEGLLSASEGSSRNVKNEEEWQVLKNAKGTSDNANKEAAGHDENNGDNKKHKYENCAVETAPGGDVETALTNHNGGERKKCDDEGDGDATTPANCKRGGDVGRNKKRGVETAGVDGGRRGDAGNATGRDANSAFNNNNWSEEMDYISTLTFT